MEMSRKVRDWVIKEQWINVLLGIKRGKESSLCVCVDNGRRQGAESISYLVSWFVAVLTANRWPNASNERIQQRYY